MGFLNNIFGSKEKPIKSYDDFWEWFVDHESKFHEIVRARDTARIEQDFFGPLGAKVRQINEGYFFLVGMLDDRTVDMIFTADGNPKNIVFVEELVAAAPAIPGWVFKSAKPPAACFGLKMNGITYDESSLSFYANDHESMPDLVDITLVHEAFSGAETGYAKNGAYIFLDNYLGELNFLANIDRLEFCAPAEAEKDAIPIEALPNYLETRASLFVEKYDGVRIFTDNDNYAALEWQTENGCPAIAIVNTDLLKWDKKASHPWMMVVTIPYDGSNNNGMPDSDTMEKMNRLEDAFREELKDVDGYLNIGRQTSENQRHIFFASIDFRQPSKVTYELQKRYRSGFDLEYEIFKDKYWQSVRHFSPQEEQ
jgi:hypothetical protein